MGAAKNDNDSGNWSPKEVQQTFIIPALKEVTDKHDKLQSLYDRQTSTLNEKVGDNKTDINNIGRELRKHKEETGVKLEYHGKKITLILGRMAAASAVAGVAWLLLSNYKTILPG